MLLLTTPSFLWILFIKKMTPEEIINTTFGECWYSSPIMQCFYYENNLDAFFTGSFLLLLHQYLEPIWGAQNWIIIALIRKPHLARCKSFEIVPSARRWSVSFSFFNFFNFCSFRYQKHHHWRLEFVNEAEKKIKALRLKIEFNFVSSCSFDYSHLSNKRSLTIILFGKILQATEGNAM